MEVIYGGFTYNLKDRQPITPKPRAINWRYQIPGLEIDSSIESANAISPQPKAINWRYQINKGI